MNQLPVYDILSQYKQLKKSQKELPGQNFPPQIFNNVLSEKELLNLQKEFDEYPENKIDVQGYSGLGTLYLNHMHDIVKRVEKIVSDAVGEEIVVVEVGGTRYSPEFGWEVKLGPHFDLRPFETFVFDLQINSNQKWGLFFEGERFDLENNQALLFSGTSQIHWREPIILDDNTRVDLIFFWMQHKNAKPIEPTHIDIMKRRQGFLLDSIKIMSPLDQSQWWKPVSRSSNSKNYPHYEKLNVKEVNPFTHNEIYKSVINDYDYNYIIDMFNGSNDYKKDIVLSDNVIKQVVYHIKNVYPEFNFEFTSFNFIKNLNKDVIDYFSKQNKEMITIAIKLDTDNIYKIFINSKEFLLKNSDSLILSFGNQNVDINNIDSKFLFCNFSLIDGPGK